MDVKEKLPFIKETIQQTVTDFNTKMEENQLPDLKLKRLILENDTLIRGLVKITCPPGYHREYIVDANGNIIGEVCVPD